MIARRYEWDIDTLWQSLLAHLDTLPRPVRERPQLSEPLAALIRQAWLIASLEGDDPADPQPASADGADRKTDAARL